MAQEGSRKAIWRGPAVLAAVLVAAGAISPAFSAADLTKAQVKKIVKKQVKKLAPTLSVKNAKQLGGVDADQYQQRLFAVVDEDATLVRGAGAVSAELAATAHYDVAFNRNVTACAYQATLGSVDSILGPAGYAVVAQDPTDPNGVRVRTHNSAGALAPASFHLEVAC
jgi:hypothetical protein